MEPRTLKQFDFPRLEQKEQHPIMPNHKLTIWRGEKTTTPQILYNPIRKQTETTQNIILKKKE